MTDEKSVPEHPREVQWYLAKYIPDLARGEPKNVGLLFRSADGDLTYRFWTKPPFARDLDIYREWVTYWVSTIDKYGVKCLHWLPKRRAGDNYFIEFSGARMVSGNVDLDEMYKRLVDDAGDPAQCDLEPEKRPGWWKK